MARQVLNANMLKMLGNGLLALTLECLTIVQKVVGGLAHLYRRLAVGSWSGAQLTMRSVNKTCREQFVIVPPRQGEVMREHAHLVRIAFGNGASKDLAVERSHVTQIGALTGHPSCSRITSSVREHGLDLLGRRDEQRDVHTGGAVDVERSIDASSKLRDREEHQTDRSIEFGGRSVLRSAGIAWRRSRRPRPVELLRRGDRGDVALLLVILPEELQFLMAAGMLVVHASEQSGPPDELLGVRVEITSFTMQLEHHSFAGSPGMGSQGFGNSRLELMHLVAAGSATSIP